MKTTLAAFAILGLMQFTAPDSRADAPVKIAFVDTGNTGRSVTAEALANALAGAKNLPVAVIGRAVDMDPFDVHPEANAAAILQTHGIDVSRHVAAQLTANDVRHADVIITMTAKHKATVTAQFPEVQAKVFTIAEYATGQSVDVVDAYGKPMEVYEATFKQIDGYMAAVLDKATRK